MEDLAYGGEVGIEGVELSVEVVPERAGDVGEGVEAQTV